jgi:hypothetical protein
MRSSGFCIYSSIFEVEFAKAEAAFKALSQYCFAPTQSL